MANVVIITPRNSLVNPSPNTRPPAGPLYLAATLLERGHTVRIVDESVEPQARQAILEAIGPDTHCVGISSLSGHSILAALDVAAFIRQRHPDLPIVWGGSHPTISPLGTLEHELVDAICIGEGEVSFPLMVEAYRDGTPLDGIQGIGFKRGGKPVLTEPRKQYFDLDALPSLPYHLVDLDLYKSVPYDNFFGFRGSRVLTLEMSRGCPFRCLYCVQSVKKERFRVMSPATALRFLEDMVKAGADGVSMADDNFFTNHKRAKEVMRAILERKWPLEFFVAARSDYLARLDDEAYDLMRRIGIVMLGIGVESGSDDMLRRIGKKEHIAVTYEANRLLARKGIHAYFHFIVGFPGETLADIVATYNAMGRIMLENPCAKVTNKKLIPLPGTPVAEECFRLGMPRPATMEEWADTQDLLWERHAPYVQPAAERWYHNVKYFDRAASYLSMLRTPHATPERKRREKEFLGLFRWMTRIIRLRGLLGYTGPGPDTRWMPRLLDKAAAKLFG